MRIGLPREIKDGERRVALTPEAVAEIERQVRVMITAQRFVLQSGEAS